MGLAGFDTSHTIFALSSGQPPTAVCVIRLSGPQAFEIAEKCFAGNALKSLPRERGMHFGEFVEPESRARIDSGLVLTFAVPRSFTGENVVEFQGHGSAVVIHALEHAFVRLGARRAEPGEFAYRAFLNGKLSLSDIENLGDVFLASDFAGLSRIYQRREPSLERQVEALRSQLLDLQAVMDTAIDFSEEYSAAIQQGRPMLTQVTQACREITHRYSAFSQGSLVPRAVLAGAPNAGKSSLFNGLLGRDRVIVSREAGTTRDAVEEDFEFNRRKWKLVDTAGIRETVSEIERDGIEKGESFLSGSSVWILVVDGTEGLSATDALLLERFHSKPLVIVWNKKDLPEWEEPAAAIGGSFPIVAVSTVSGEGIVALGEKLNELAGGLGSLEGPLPTESQTARLSMVLDKLSELESQWSEEIPPEYIAEQIRSVNRSLEGVLVPIVSDEVLGRIFSRFCIGK